VPKLLHARVPEDPAEVSKIRKLAGSRHAPGDWILRARIVSLSWQGLRSAKIAEELGCHPKTVRKRLHRFNALGIDGLGDRPGAGRKPRITEEERSKIVALVAKDKAGQTAHRLRRRAWGRRREQGSLLDTGCFIRSRQGDGYRGRTQPGEAHPAS
jgi:transposase-like protein